MAYMEVNEREITDSLSRSVLEVIFDKLNGEQRVMRCTLIKDMLPPNRDPIKVQQFHEHNSAELNAGLEKPKGVVTVWDLDTHGWRSFRVDRVVSAQALNWG